MRMRWIWPYEYNSQDLGDYYLGFISNRAYYSILYLITAAEYSTFSRQRNAALR